MSSRTTTAVAGARNPPAPAAAAGENIPARQAPAAPAPSTRITATPAAIRRRRWRGPPCCAATPATSCWPASPPRETVLLTTRHLPFDPDIVFSHLAHIVSRRLTCCCRGVLRG